MKLAVKIGRSWAHQLGGASDIRYRTLANGGTGPISFRLKPSSDAILSGHVDDQAVQVFEAGFRVGYGTVDDVDRETGEITCKGMWEAGRGIPALDSTGAATRNAVEAVTTAQGFGWGVDLGTVSGTVPGDDTEPTMVTDLLEQLGDATGKLVGLDPSPGALLYLRTPPTVPRWYIRPRDAQLSKVGDRPNVLSGRYTDSTGVRRTLRWPSPLPSPARSELVDITRFGRLTTAQAQDVLSGIYSLAQVKDRWTNDLVVPLSRITTVGGVSPTSATQIVAGDMARIYLGAAARRELDADFVDVILGAVDVADGARSVGLEALGTVPLTVREALEEVASR